MRNIQLEPEAGSDLSGCGEIMDCAARLGSKNGFILERILWDCLLTDINVDIGEVIKVRSVIYRGHIDCNGRGPVPQVTPVHIFHPAQLFHLLQAGHSAILGRQ